MPLMHLLLVLGFVASLLMFAGDMLLYFTTGTYDMDGSLRPYMRIMRDMPAGRIKAGGCARPRCRGALCCGLRSASLHGSGRVCMACLDRRGAARLRARLRGRLSRAVRLSPHYRQGGARGSL